MAAEASVGAVIQAGRVGITETPRQGQMACLGLRLVSRTEFLRQDWQAG